jgi:hypothetical protein
MALFHSVYQQDVSRLSGLHGAASSAQHFVYLHTYTHNTWHSAQHGRRCTIPRGFSFFFLRQTDVVALFSLANSGQSWIILDSYERNFLLFLYG